jgi:hypothetical protein
MKMKVTYLSGGPDRELGLWNLTNVTIQGDQYPNICVLKNVEVFVPYNERTMSLGANVFTMPEIHHERTETITSPVFFFIYNTDNYFHYLYDSLPILYQFFELRKRYPDLQLLMKPAHNYPYIMDCLRTLGINEVLIAQRGYEYASMWISSSLTHDGQSNSPPHPGVWSIYNRMKSHTPSKIYISRRSWIHGDTSNIGTNYTTRRQLVNEDEIVEKLSKHGYQEVFTEKLSTIEKIICFANATHVVGAIGGGISNVLFSSPVTKLTVLVSPTFLDVNKRFKYSLDCVDVTYNMNSSHVETGQFKKYMRVKTKDNKLIGEIEKIYDNKLIVSYTDGSNTGWNSQNIFNTKELLMDDVDKLDEGLNSAWTIHL